MTPEVNYVLLRDEKICVTELGPVPVLEVEAVMRKFCKNSNMETLSQSILPTDRLQYSQELVERLDILRRNESFCDVKVAVKDKDFNVHKAVLAAASPFFLTLLVSDMRESKEQMIKIELAEATASVMEDVLQYVYTGNVSVTEESAHNLIATADYLLLPGLKTMACNFLEGNLTVENCIFNYYFADKYQCVELREGAREVMNLNFTAVMETEDFLSLNMKQVMEWVSSDDITVNAEQEVFKGIVKWVSHNKSEREVDFPILLQKVRLVSISHDFLLNKLVKEDLVAKNTLCLNFVLEGLRLMVSTSDEQVIKKPRKCLETHTNAIFVCGGRRSLCYFPKQNVWYKLSNMLRGHNCEQTPSQCRGKIYIPCETSDELDVSELMECYTPATNSWGLLEVEPGFTSTIVFKGDLYAIHVCEILFGNSLGLEIHKYDSENNCSNELEEPPTACYKSCLVADEQHIYVIGGLVKFYGGESLTSKTLRFDPCANEWEEVASINEARYAAFGAAMNGKVYVAGGCQNEKVLSTCEVYNPLTNEWQLMPSLMVPRFSASMVCHERELYVLGGCNYVTVNSRRRSLVRVLSVEIFDCEMNEWKEKSAIPVNCFETDEEKEKNKFKACFARLCKGVLNKLEQLEC